ncbi:MAG: single-stranded DNA-binding protein [Deltaproteobacteria bacterium]|nr:MAG: single-stranded DNA-binding protein [Deltaproteobacteria bacterium]
MNDDPITISRWLAQATANLTFSEPVSHVYRPLHYAWGAHEAYLAKYGAGRPRRVILLGMNPGPWGMAQTGVPFGAVRPVREWLGISAPIGRPEREHPARPVRGLACTRNEVSGTRLWGWAQRRFQEPERFFSDFFVANYCPLLFLEASGRNRTPDRLRKGERETLFSVCDEALARLIEWFGPRFVIGIGAFAESRIRIVLDGRREVTIGRLPHPSPANPAANRGWSELAERTLREIGVFA